MERFYLNRRRFTQGVVESASSCSRVAQVDSSSMAAIAISRLGTSRLAICLNSVPCPDKGSHEQGCWGRLCVGAMGSRGGSLFFNGSPNRQTASEKVSEGFGGPPHWSVWKERNTSPPAGVLFDPTNAFLDVQEIDLIALDQRGTASENTPSRMPGFRPFSLTIPHPSAQEVLEITGQRDARSCPSLPPRPASMSISLPGLSCRRRLTESSNRCHAVPTRKFQNRTPLSRSISIVLIP